MGKCYTPAEKRLRGFMSGDAERIARTAERTIGIADQSVHRHMAEHADELRAALRKVALPYGLRARIDAYLDNPTGARGGSTHLAVSSTCACDRPRGDPARLAGFKLLSAQYYAGHADIVVQCSACGAIWDVVEDVGYHVPQWQWQRRRF